MQIRWFWRWEDICIFTPWPVDSRWMTKCVLLTRKHPIRTELPSANYPINVCHSQTNDKSGLYNPLKAFWDVSSNPTWILGECRWVRICEMGKSDMRPDCPIFSVTLSHDVTICWVTHFSMTTWISLKHLLYFTISYFSQCATPPGGFEKAHRPP